MRGFDQLLFEIGPAGLAFIRSEHGQGVICFTGSLIDASVAHEQKREIHAGLGIERVQGDSIAIRVFSTGRIVCR
jgi:hypothetical protein